MPGKKKGSLRLKLSYPQSGAEIVDVVQLFEDLSKFLICVGLYFGKEEHNT
jgi:hypothetical protein